MCVVTEKNASKKIDKDLHVAKCGAKAKNEPRNIDAADDENDEDGFSLTKSTLSGFAKVYRLNFGKGIRNLFPRLQKAMEEAYDQLFTIQRSNENVKYYISLHCLFYKPTDPDCVTDPAVVLNSECSILLAGSNLEDQMKVNYDNLIHSIDNYETNGSGWCLLNFISLDVNTVRYNPLKAMY